MWEGLIESRKRTPDQIITMVESKFRMTDGQKAKVRSLAAPANEAETVEGEPA